MNVNVMRLEDFLAREKKVEKLVFKEMDQDIIIFVTLFNQLH